MRTTFICLSLLLFFTACSNLETVENKDGSGNLTEKFTKDKKTGKREGQYLSFYPNGQKLEESWYVNDSLHGERKLFYENGKVESIEHHEHGQYVGSFQKFNENGQLTNEGQYANNEMTGVWKRWYDTGELREEVTFAANAENGPFKEFHQNGKPKAEGTYLNGENEQGELKMYDEAGDLVEKKYCEYGNCKTSWSKEKGDMPVDTAQLKALAEMKKQSENQ